MADESDTDLGDVTINLDDFLKMCGVVETGGEAKRIIQGGEVEVNGKVERHRRRKLRPGDKVTFDDETIEVEFDEDYVDPNLEES
jgi:ribosome-associated protein